MAWGLIGSPVWSCEISIGRELADIEQAMGQCRGDAIAEPRVTGTWMAHLLISSKELLLNLLIEGAGKPQRIEPRGSGDQAPGSSVG